MDKLELMSHDSLSNLFADLNRRLASLDPPTAAFLVQRWALQLDLPRIAPRATYSFDDVVSNIRQRAAAEPVIAFL